MKEFEYRRTVFYQMHGHESFEDEHKNFDYGIHESSVVKDAVTYLLDGSSYLKFPGAARAVAIAVADFIAREFNEDFFSVLNNPELMHGNDPFFKTYQEDKSTYDEILKLVPREKIVWESPRMAITHRLIRQEYMLDPEGLQTLPRNTWIP
ncbi:hypothetical protein [Peredibacter starrii]|uniref:Uncharacterized protein n=1 Tax=Peredibacter starrii TaxID=28202 RepID=A0AAX4HR03_9BACT|nr:hypothetical protein [Peredibacter starrii]WPU65630.1 hypothetical protein SOO65_02600 [Peredibacter starrii]